VRKWLTYITLFIAGLTLAGDLVTVLYYFIDGQELTAGFLLKVLSVLVVILAVFLYYISDIREKLTSRSRKVWVAISAVVIIVSIIWGFVVLGSPWTQQQIKYDEQRVSDLQNINYQVQNYYQTNGSLPNTISDLSGVNYSTIPVDPQTGKPYEYVLGGQSTKSYQLCATFNKDSKNTSSVLPVGVSSPYVYDGGPWFHTVGHFCFAEAIPVSQIKSVPNTLVAPVQ
jgi:4-amino-4-deoxy-L-arabinose transferase-like glycosyltransferase